jgi:hypothetical protein
LSAAQGVLDNKKHLMEIVLLIIISEGILGLHHPEKHLGFWRIGYQSGGRVKSVGGVKVMEKARNFATPTVTCFSRSRNQKSLPRIAFLSWRVRGESYRSSPSIIHSRAHS